jgi:hypothetical protein
MKKILKFNRTTWVFVLVVIVLAGFISLLIISMNNQPSSKGSRTTAGTNYNFSISDISSLKEKLLSNYPSMEEEAIDQTPTLGYRVGQANFRVSLATSNGFTLGIKNSVSETATYKGLATSIPYINNFFKVNGFGKPQTATASNSLLSIVDFYQNRTDVCELTIYSLLDVTCSSITSLNNLASSEQPFATLYLTAKPDASLPSVIRPDIEKSQSAGYQFAYVDFYNSPGETKVDFYRQGSSPWQMVNLNWYNDPNEDGDIIPNCGYFESVPAIKLAFTGVACYNSVTLKQSTI